ncbi:LacI family DNA-binding transcriptional regulator [Lichenicoccus sp.]|uniref:LacI family DNA-binding transcriptional regulator n=1 Tax=Lichenicoccus sp. TaxID=2781899 RepID=UPI003D0A1399
MARLREVAQAAGVSAATVSRYLNRSLILPAETAARIESVIRSLDYRPNPHARRLSRGRSDTIGLVIPDVANPFFAGLADAVEQEAELHGLGLLLFATRNRSERELDAISRIGRTLVDGLIFVTNHADDGSLARAINAERGVVLLDEDIAAAQAPKILADNHNGGVLAGRHLIMAGHRRLGFIGGPQDLLSTTERRAGLRDAVLQAGPACSVTFENFGDYTADAGRAAASRLLNMTNRPTGLFAASDKITLGLLDGLRAGAMHIPRDMSLVTFDDVGPLHLLDPPLTAIRQPLREMARRGVDLLLARLRGESMPEQTVRLPVQLIDRASVIAPRRNTISANATRIRRKHDAYHQTGVSQHGSRPRGHNRA